jgi:tRNA 5-methylaminomethyl-2-thiouridine biosynthesis bifunctional protein
MTQQAKTVTVIGAGIAGCASAYTLANKGWQVTLIERQAAVAQEGSGNPRGVIYPRLAGHETIQDQLALSSYIYTLKLLTSLGLAQHDMNLCGLLQLGFNQREATRLQEIAKRKLGKDIAQYVNAEQASAIAGIALSYDALYFPQAGWLKPSACCKALIENNIINIKYNTEVIDFININNLWKVQSENGFIAQAEAIVIANANDALQFKLSAHLPLTAVRGQMSSIEATSQSAKIKTVLCSDGYLTPALEHIHCLGATFTTNETSTEVRLADNLSNLAMIKKISAELSSLDVDQMHGRAALRCTTPDYMPLVGELINATSLRLLPPKHISPAPALLKHKGLFVNLGHGSKGLTTAPFCAEILACMMSQQPLPASLPLVQALNPNRYLLKELGLKRLIADSTLR